jgi:hypothetical protein
MERAFLRNANPVMFSMESSAMIKSVDMDSLFGAMAMST